jgi:hypothetical protein
MRAGQGCDPAGFRAFSWLSMFWFLRDHFFPTRVRKTRFSYCRLPAINSILYSHGKRVLQLLHNFSGKWNKGFTVPAGYKNSIIPRWTPLYHDELYYTTVWKLEWHSFFALLVGKSNIRTSEICVRFFYFPCEVLYRTSGSAFGTIKEVPVKIGNVSRNSNEIK